LYGTAIKAKNIAVLLIDCVHFYFTTARSASAMPTKNKKCTSLLVLQISFPPEKQLAGAARRQRKNRPRGRQFPEKFRFGAILHFCANRIPA
jgi:hypothetical protein